MKNVLQQNTEHKLWLYRNVNEDKPNQELHEGVN